MCGYCAISDVVLGKYKPWSTLK